MYFMQLDVVKEDWSLLVTNKCVKNPLTRLGSLHLSISMRQTPDPSGIYHIREGYPSGEQQGQGDAGWRHYQKFMVSTGWSHHWCQNWGRWQRWPQVKIRISKISTSTINGNIFSVCSFFRCHAREGIPGHTCKFESNHGSENGGNHFACAGLNKRSNHNRGCEILLTYDTWILTIQYSVGQRSGYGAGIGPRVGALNLTIRII